MNRAMQDDFHPKSASVRSVESQDKSLLSACHICHSPVSTLLDFGPRPVTNRFSLTEDDVVPNHSVVLTQCSACATIQLVNPCSPHILKPPRPMLYNEPEGHLDALVEELLQLPGVTRSSRFVGLTYKEATTLERLQRRGCDQTLLLSAEKDWHIDDPCAGLETLQERITPQRCAEVADRHGRFDVVLVRHVLEHAHNPLQFIYALQQLVVPSGYLVFEVPDCTTALEQCDYSVLWEEHVTYFTPATLARTLVLCGLPVERLLIYPYTLENSLVAIVRASGVLSSSPPCDLSHLFRGIGGKEKSPDPFSSELQRGQAYSKRFAPTRACWRATLADLRRRGPLALLGAGHLAITFINLLELEDLVDLICDDAPDKVGRWLPGTKLRIWPSAILLQQPIKLCLMAVAPESEPKVLARNQAFLDNGGQFASIFPASQHALQLNDFDAVSQ